MRVRWARDDFETLGYIQGVLDDEDPRSAREQLHVSYLHGGGWHPFEGFTLTQLEVGPNPTHGLAYPGDPTLLPISTARMRDEVIHLYRHAWVAIVQPDGSFEVSRMD